MAKTVKTDYSCDSKKVFSFLKELTVVEWNVLKHCMELAELLKDTKVNFGLSDEWLAAELEITKRKLADLQIGAYDFDLMLIARINAMVYKLRVEYAREYPPIQIPPKERKKST